MAGTKTLVDPSAETSMSRDPALEQAAADAGAQVVDPSAEQVEMEDEEEETEETEADAGALVDPSAEASMSRDPALEQVEMEDEEEETEETETDAGADVGAQVR